MMCSNHSLSQETVPVSPGESARIRGWRLVSVCLVEAASAGGAGGS